MTANTRVLGISLPIPGHSHRRHQVPMRWAMASVVALTMTGCLNDPISPVGGVVPEVAAVTITMVDPPSLAQGRSVVLQAVLKDGAGARISLAPVKWTSTNPAIIRVQPGVYNSTQASAVATSIGAVTITATSGSKTATIALDVHGPGPVASISVLGIFYVPVGKASQLTVVLRDSDGVRLSNTIPTFASSDSSVLTVSSSGLAFARSAGTATLSATSNGIMGSIKVTTLAGERAFLWTAATGMIDLGVLPGFATSRAYAVSSVGHVAGSLLTPADSLSHAFVRSPGVAGVMRDLGGLTGTGQSEAFGVNAGGVVVGYATNANGARHAVLWSANGTIQDLGTLPGGAQSTALAINDAGQVVGWSQQTGSGTEPFIWTAAGGMRTISGAGEGVAYAINQAGTVAGQSKSRAFLWSASTLVALPPIVGGYATGAALAINDAGETIGTSIGCDYYYYYDDDCFNPLTHSVLWAGANTPVDLRAVTGRAGAFDRVAGINNIHQVVGTSDTGHAIVWSAAGGLLDLGLLPNRLQSAALAINDAGVIVGWSGNP